MFYKQLPGNWARNILSQCFDGITDNMRHRRRQPPLHDISMPPVDGFMDARAGLLAKAER
jgi:hypothetical protein